MFAGALASTEAGARRATTTRRDRQRDVTHKVTGPDLTPGSVPRRRAGPRRASSSPALPQNPDQVSLKTLGPPRSRGRQRPSSLDSGRRSRTARSGAGAPAGCCGPATRPRPRRTDLLTATRAAPSPERSRPRPEPPTRPQHKARGAHLPRAVLTLHLEPDGQRPGRAA